MSLSFLPCQTCAEAICNLAATFSQTSDAFLLDDCPELDSVAPGILPMVVIRSRHFNRLIHRLCGKQYAQRMTALVNTLDFQKYATNIVHDPSFQDFLAIGKY